MAKEIIRPIEGEEIESELKGIGLFRKTNKAENEIYIVSADYAPKTMMEIGRLREIAFRNAGGGTGRECDLDEFDTAERGYRQLIVWNPADREIIGGYRYIHGKDVSFDQDGEPRLTSAHLFAYSQKFIDEYLPYSIELGRSFVRTEYQSSTKGAKSLFAMDNLWDGLGGLIASTPNLKYFFGKATVYPRFGRREFDMISYVLGKHFRDTDGLMHPKKEIKMVEKGNELRILFDSEDFQNDYLALKRELKRLGKNIPPMINTYMTLSPTLRVFGAAVNDEFGDVYETGLMVNIKDMYEAKVKRHIETYRKQNIH